MNSLARRQQRERLGRRAEVLAAWYLRAKGYRILAVRERTPAGEIDLVACRGRTLVFVEVKARREREQLHEAVTPRMQQRLAAAARALSARYDTTRWPDRRFDVLWVAPWRWPVHVTDAIQTGHMR